MGALAPVSAWKPEDDLSLKNAVEAGASLESLAKGAVQFSRKFTIRELQDRWHSLLYDPLVSEEASLRMTELERSTSNLPPKFSRTGNSKESKSLSGKRKAESVRSRYHALRKRIRNEPFNSMDLNFLIAPSDNNYIGNEDEPLPGNGMLEDSTSNQLEFEETHMDIIRQAFPEILADGGSANRDDGTAHGFHTGLQNPVEDNFPMQKDNIHEESPHMLGDNLAFTRNGSGIDEMSQQKVLPVNSIFECDDLVGKPSSTLGQIHNHPGNACCDSEGKQVFNSPISECGASFHNLEYSSPLPPMPIWRAVDGISAPDAPLDVSLGEKDLHEGDDSHANITSTSGCDVVHTDSKWKLLMPSDELKSPTANTDSYLAELSNSLFNEEELFMDVDVKDVIDKSYYDGLSSLLLNSPNDVNQDQMPNVTEPEISVTMNCLKNASGACLGESNNNERSEHAGGNTVCNSESQILSAASASDPRFPELHNGVICCTLSTEDTEIPCNDDVFLPKQSHPLSVSSLARRNFKEPGNLISKSVKAFSGNQERSERYPVFMQRGRKDAGQSHASSQTIGSQVRIEMGQLHPVGECGVKFEFPTSDSPLTACRSVGISCGGSTLINSKNVSTDTHLSTMLKGESKETAVVKHSFTEKPPLDSDTYKSYPKKDAGGIKEEPEVPATIQNHQASNAEVASIDIAASELVVHPPTSEPKELPIESDDDVPYYSDIEAMILDMDLDPDEQDLYELEVSRYQHEEAKRAIIRLEQGAHSYMQRAIASHGAFAIFYGRHSKHYIKKPEVLLGRATEGVAVDIDLGREGRSNKISRRQAIIHLDKDGSFHLKNLGKFSVSMNTKEVAPGQSLSLNSSCLIEIRGMPFIFETNQTCVKRYLDGIEKDQTRSIKVE